MANGRYLSETFLTNEEFACLNFAIRKMRDFWVEQLDIASDSDRDRFALHVENCKSALQKLDKAFGL